MGKATILTFCSHYLPGCKAGGPIQSIANLVDRLSDEFDFRIVARDRDLGSSSGYIDCPRDTWKRVGGAQVLYLQPDQLRFSTIVDLLRSTHHDAVYLNSFFSRHFSVYPLLSRSLGLVPATPIVLAPRGEFAISALKRRRLAKRGYIALTRGFLRRMPVTWQASSAFEARDIQRQFRSPEMLIASDLATQPPPLAIRSKCKQAGKAKILFLSRIHPIKNLEGAIEILREAPGEIEFNVYGPVEDAQYWQHCQRLARRLPPKVTMIYRGALERSQISPVMTDHDLLLLPTFGENFGHVILEALSAGTPALISDQTPWRNLKNSGVGWEFPLSHVNRFREAIGAIVRMDEADRNRIAIKAWEFAGEFCRDNTMVEQNRLLFRTALGLLGPELDLQCRVA